MQHKTLRTFFYSYFKTLHVTFSRLDATAITMVKKNDGDLGKQRLFGVIGQAVFVIITVYKVPSLIILDEFRYNDQNCQLIFY